MWNYLPAFSGITNKERPKAILTLINSIKERVGKKKKKKEGFGNAFPSQFMGGPEKKYWI